MKRSLALLLPLLSLTIQQPLSAQNAQKPLKILLITGGCCHDYATQKDLLKNGIEKRIHAVVDQVHTDVEKANATKPPLPIYGNPDYAKGYDLVIHDECAADISDESVILGVLNPHKKGIPGLNLHCAMHCYRIGKAGDPVELGTPHGYWFEYLGLQSSGHGPQEPITIAHLDKKDPIVRDLPEWTTIKEELYNNIRIFDTAHPLSQGKQVVKKKNPKEGEPAEEEKQSVVTWTNTYLGKTRVFSTTLGHNNKTVADDRYLDLVTRGVLWATQQLQSDGTPKPGIQK